MINKKDFWEILILAGLSFWALGYHVAKWANLPEYGFSSWVLSDYAFIGTTVWTFTFLFLRISTATSKSVE